MLVSGYSSLPNCTMIYYVFSGSLSLPAYVPEIKFNNNNLSCWLCCARNLVWVREKLCSTSCSVSCGGSWRSSFPRRFPVESVGRLSLKWSWWRFNTLLSYRRNAKVCGPNPFSVTVATHFGCPGQCIVHSILSPGHETPFECSLVMVLFVSVLFPKVSVIEYPAVSSVVSSTQTMMTLSGCSLWSYPIACQEGV